MVAFHYPPYQGSSGVLRTWSFSRQLGRFGWDPIVLTANTRAYESVQGPGGGALEIPPHVPVQRAFALDAARHLSLLGRYPRWLALPDRWISWYPGAVVKARRIIVSEKPAVIWSTYPIATAHMVACSVHKHSGLPWVADFRDSMTEDRYPSDPRKRAVYMRIERQTVSNASALVFTTEATSRMYRERYPAIAPEKFHVVANGYDEESFVQAEAMLAQARSSPATTLTMLHSGVLYPSERDPRPLFAALAKLKKSGLVHSGNLRLVLRATGHDSLLAELRDNHDIADIVKLAPTIPYRDALSEMLSVDALLLMQAANSNHQIPAKVYEYFRAGKPILALTDTAGDTAKVLRAAGIDTIADIADAGDIEAKLPLFLGLLRAGAAPVADRKAARQYSRESQAEGLANILTYAAGSTTQAGGVCA